MTRKLLTQTKLGSIIKLTPQGKEYLFNTLDRADAILIDRAGKERITSLETTVYLISDRTTYRRDFVNAK